MIDLTEYKQIARSLQSANYIGKITKITGLIIESVGFRDSKVLLMPLGNFAGIKPGSIVKNTYSAMKIQVGKGLIGRVLNGLGEPIDAFATIGKGQRMGVFAGSGVGKSTTLGMIAKNTNANLNVIALIGERGRDNYNSTKNSLKKKPKKKAFVFSLKLYFKSNKNSF